MKPIAATFADFKMIKTRGGLIAWFEEKFIGEPNSGCWLWMGSCHPYGYGRIKIGNKTVAAHRVSWAIHNGDIPPGMFICHKCDTPPCVNPAHLFLGTALDNAVDRENKGRGNQVSGDRNGARTHPEKLKYGAESHLFWTGHLRRGELNGRAKITAAEVYQVRSVQGHTAKFAKHLGVSTQTIKQIRRRRLWGSLP